MDKSNSLAENTILLSVGNIGTKILNIILLPLYTSWLTPEEFGSYDLITSIVMFTVPITTLQLEQALFRYVYNNPDDKKRIYSVSINCCLLFYMILSVASLLFCSLIPYYPLLMLYILFQCIYIIVHEFERGVGRLNAYVGYSFFNIFIVFVLNLIFIKILDIGITGILLSYILSYIVCATSLLITQRQYQLGIHKDDRILIKRLLAYSLPLIPNTVAFWVINLSDRFLINYYLGTYENGIYGVACKIPALMTTVYSAFILAWQQEAIGLIEKEKYDAIKDIFCKVVKLVFQLIILITLSLPIIFMVINERYYNSLYMIPILLLGTAFLSIAQFFNGILTAKLKTSEIGVSTTIAAIINLVVNLLLMKKYGVVIGAISTLLSYIALFTIRAIRDKQSFSIKAFYIMISAIIIEIIAYIVLIFCERGITIIFGIVFGIYIIIDNRELILRVIKRK